MSIVIKDKSQALTSSQLEDLFLSVEWSSGHYPDKLAIAMQNYETVYTAWDGDTLLVSSQLSKILTLLPSIMHFLSLRFCSQCIVCYFRIK